MNWNPNSNKHKAKHGGYKVKPSKSEVKALLNLYSSTSNKTVMPIAKKQEGVQLKIEF